MRWPGPNGDADGAGGIDDLAGLTLETETVETVLELVIALARAVVDHVDGVGASVLRTGSAETIVATDEVLAVERAQFRSRGGPAVEAMLSGQRQHVVVDYARTEWPEFADLATNHGFRSVLALPLLARDQVIGTLALYSCRAAAFGAVQVEIAEALARRAAVTVANALTIAHARLARDNLEEGLVTRGLIGQAQGIVMVRDGCDGQQAFAKLRDASQVENRKLRDVAAEVVAQHERSLPSR